MKFTEVRFSYFLFFLKKLKWNILSTQNVFPRTRCAKEKH